MAIAVVTGSSTGIGQATAVSLARAGHTIYATMRSPNNGGGDLREIAKKESLPIHITEMDVDSDDSVRSGFARILDHAKRIDVLVNNAGIGNMGPVEETPLSVFRAVMETNFFGALRCTQAVLPEMRKRKSGCIVNVTSVAGRISGAPQAPYSASKWALEALSESLAQEVKAFGIRVAVVEPGVIATPIFGKVAESDTATNYPHRRRLMALFHAALENPASPYIVGDKIREIVDSGTWQFRHLAGPDAAGFMAWRASMTDEQWADWGAQTDEQWLASVSRILRLKVKL
jgi:NAD(P)-dependent dehydrogenase (short-subunit alcohol dehydrogenase family)